MAGLAWFGMCVVSFCGLIRLVCGTTHTGMCLSDVLLVWFLLLRDWLQCCCAAGVSSVDCWLGSPTFAGLVSSHGASCACVMQPVKAGGKQFFWLCQCLYSLYKAASTGIQLGRCQTVLSSTCTPLAVHGYVIVQLYYYLLLA